ncbi:hypothetical protein EDD18DRAFT_1086749, partial [Armillaria luteobubalina]
FTYSADYPEKCVMSDIKLLGKCLCPRCLIMKDRVSELGTKQDRTWCMAQEHQDMTARQFDVEMVWEWIYTKGFPVGGAQIEKVLGPTSLTPSRVCPFIHSSLSTFNCVCRTHFPKRCYHMV